MEMFSRILLPTDGSEAARTAVELGFELAETHDSTVHGLFVVEDQRPVARLDETIASGSVDILAQLQEEGGQIVEAVVAESHDRDIAVQSTVQHGNPSDEIIDYAADNDIDLIVMGSHGRTGVKRALLGSVTENVARHADIPVLIAE